MSSAGAQLAGLSLADRFARQSTPFPHNTSTVLFRGEAALNTAHLRSANAPSTRSTGVRGIPAGGRFSFQFRQKRKVSRDWMMTSHRVASAKGVRILGYKGCTFYGSGAGKNWPLQAKSVASHAYPGFNIVYSIRNDAGELIAKGSAEYLDAIHTDVPFAFKGYWERQNENKIKPFYIRRYFAHFGCIGPLRWPLLRFLDLDLLQLIQNSPMELVNAYAAIAWMEKVKV